MAVRSLEHVLSFLLFPHNYDVCTCDLRPTMAIACASPWLKEQVLLHGAYALGSCSFELKELPETAAAVAEVGEKRWLEHQLRYTSHVAELSRGRSSVCVGGRSPRGRPLASGRLRPYVRRLTIHLYKDEDSRRDEERMRTAAERQQQPRAPIPPLSSVIAWWRPLGWAVNLKGRRCSLAEMEALLQTVQGAWSCPVSGLCVEGYSRPNPEEEKEAVSRLMNAAADTLRCLEVECLEMLPSPPARSDLHHHVSTEGETARKGEVRRLLLKSCASRFSDVAAWLRDSPLEALLIHEGTPFHTSLHLSKGSRSNGGGPPVTELTPLTPPTLRRLMLNGTDVTPEHVASIRCRQGLLRLGLTDCDQIDEVDLAGMEHLEALFLERCHIASTDSLVHLARCKTLVLLNVSGCSEIVDLNVVAELPRLRELFAYHTGVTNGGILGLGMCTSLEKLNLGSCQRVTDVTPLGTLTALKELHLWGTRVNNHGIAALSGCTSLAELLLDGCQRVTDVTPLSTLPHLRWLSLIDTGVTPSGIAALSKCPTLEVLAIAGTEIVDAPRLWNRHSVREFLSRVVSDQHP